MEISPDRNGGRRQNFAKQPVQDRYVQMPIIKSTNEFLRSNVSRRAILEQSKFSRIHRGAHAQNEGHERIRVPGWADERWLDLFQSGRALQLVRPDALIAGPSAAVLVGWPVPLWLEHGPLTVTTHPTRCRVVRPGIRPRISERYSPMSFYGLDLNDKRWILIELARDLTTSDLTAVVDAIIGPWNGEPETDLDTLLTAVEGVGRYVGASNLRTALDLARPDVGSPRETHLRLAIVEAGLPEPTVHLPIELDDVVVHPDLSYPERMIAIEYEGDEHRSDPNRWTQDIERYEALQRLGWTVIRVTRKTSLPKLITRLRQLLDRPAIW